eukprot:GEMP01042145.1.p1 GENE.GEMP01042145.1~~GEMP01042145.1.p1  ORF type:complete len:395 (+),score=123.02 GEMP01042145.1:183-1367(+)
MPFLRYARGDLFMRFIAWALAGAAQFRASECSCNCCLVVERLPNEVVSNVAVKCAPQEQTQCPAQCRSRVEELPGTVDAVRFCFYACNPAHGIQSSPGTECVGLTPDQQHALVDPRRNLRDPAMLLSHVTPPRPVRPAHLAVSSSAHTRQDGTPSESPSVYAATTEAAKTKTAVETIRNRHLRPRRVKESAGQDIHRAVLDASVSAQQADTFAEEAADAVKEARKITWQAALEEGQHAMERVAAEEKAKAKADAEKMERMTNRADIKASVAAAKASEPYMTSMLRAQKTAQDYRSKGDQNAAKANKLEAHARSLEVEANKKHIAGDSVGAQAAIAEARKLMTQAQEYGKVAQQNFAMSDEVSASIPTYKAAAQAAAAKAAYDTMPAWQPPGMPR